jgi:hypothetical protein
MAEVVECLLSKREILSSKSRTTKKNLYLLYIYIYTYNM